MDTYPAEQKTLLPLAQQPAQPTPPRSTLKRAHELLESCALALILFLAASQCLILYGVHNLPYTTPSSAVCSFFTELAAGLRLSIPASLPTATLLFVASPYVARAERMLATWYLILLSYLGGSTLGALALVWL
jgi:hypothetical protein